MTDMTKLLAIFRCCRDWPVNPLGKMGRCGYCGEIPEWTNKTIAQYMAERATQNKESA